MQTSKVCITCGESKYLTDYHKSSANKDGTVGSCKVCKINYAQSVTKTKDGIVTAIYSAQKRNSKKRNHNPPSYSKRELKQWLFSQPLFHRLFDNWKRLDFQTDYKPSVDRKDDYIGYTIDNIQLMTWGENSKKGSEDRKSGRNNKMSRAVLQYTKDGVFIEEHYSVKSAARSIDKHDTNIHAVCSGKRNTLGGFIWKYKDIENG